MSIAKNSAYNLAGSLIPLLVSLAMVPLYLEAIGIERYGLLALCWTLLGHLGFLNLGLGPAVAQMMARLRKGETSEREEIFWTGFWVSFSMGLAAALIGFWAAGSYFASMEDLPLGILGEISNATGWLAAIIPVVMLSSVLTGVLQGHERFLSINLITSSMSLGISLGPLIVAYVFGPDLYGLLAATLVIRIASLGVLFIVALRTISIQRLRWINQRLLRRLLTFGGWVTFDSIIASLLVTFDRFLIGRLLGAAAVSIYTIPYSVVATIQIIPSALESVLFPRFASNLDEKHNDWLALEGITALAAVMTPITVLGMAAVEPFLFLWIGPTLAGQSAPVAFLILFALWPNSIARVPYSRLLASGRPSVIAKIHFFELPIYSAILFFGTIKFGVSGTAAAWCVRTTIDALVFVLFMRDPRLILRRLAVPLLIVSGALVTSLVLPMISPLRWIFMSAALLTATFWCLRETPQTLLRWLEKILRPIPMLRHIHRISRYWEGPKNKAGIS